MNRLIAFGCSLTYGYGLPDCHLPPRYPGPKPTQMGWASIVAKYMNRECINKSSPGSSNKRIWNEIINFEFEETDIVFIQWSFTERTAILKNKEIIDIGPWTNHDFYDSIYDHHDSVKMSKLFVSHSNMFLGSKKIKTYNIIPGKRELPILTLDNKTIEHIPTYISRLRNIYPMALDHRHPGVECQSVVAKQVLTYLNIDNDIVDYKPLGFFGQIRRQILEFRRGD